MPKSKGVVALKALPDPKPRYVPDPHRRGRVIPSKTIYNRKARTSREAGPSAFSGPRFLDRAASPASIPARRCPARSAG